MRVIHPRHTSAFTVIALALMGSGVLLGVRTPAAGAAASSSTAQAKTHLLVLADMPKGWSREKGVVSGVGGFPGAGEMTDCIGDGSTLIAAVPPEVDSPYFQSKDQTLEVQDSIVLFSSNQQAQAEYAAISNPKTPGCLATFSNRTTKSRIAASGGKGTKVGTITVTGNTTNYGEGTTSYTMNIPVSQSGGSFTLKITSIYFVKGTLGQQVTINWYGPKFPASLSKHVTSVAQGRL
jgi:hypothetical protein